MTTTTLWSLLQPKCSTWTLFGNLSDALPTKTESLIRLKQSHREVHWSLRLPQPVTLHSRLLQPHHRLRRLLIRLEALRRRMVVPAIPRNLGPAVILAHPAVILRILAPQIQAHQRMTHLVREATLRRPGFLHPAVNHLAAILLTLILLLARQQNHRLAASRPAVNPPEILAAMLEESLVQSPGMQLETPRQQIRLQRRQVPTLAQ